MKTFADHAHLKMESPRTYDSAERSLFGAHQAILDDSDDGRVIQDIEAARTEFNELVPDMPLATGKGRRQLLDAQMTALKRVYETDPELRDIQRKTTLARLEGALADFEPQARMSYQGEMDTELINDRFAPKNIYTYIGRVQVHRFARQWHEILSNPDSDDEQWRTFAANLQLGDEAAGDKTLSLYDFSQLEANTLFAQAWQNGVSEEDRRKLLGQSLEAARDAYSDPYHTSEDTPLTDDQKIAQASLRLTAGKAIHDLAINSDLAADEKSDVYIASLRLLNESLKIVNDLERQLKKRFVDMELPRIDTLGDIQLEHLKQKLRDCLIPLSCIKTIRDETSHFYAYQYPEENREAAEAALDIINNDLEEKSGTQEIAASHPSSKFITFIGSRAAADEFSIAA